MSRPSANNRITALRPYNSSRPLDLALIRCWQSVDAASGVAICSVCSVFRFADVSVAKRKMRSKGGQQISFSFGPITEKSNLFDWYPLNIVVS
jgi:hypothetical protein